MKLGHIFRSRRTSTLIILFLVTTLGIPVGLRSGYAYKAPLEQTNLARATSLASMLNADGTLDLESGYSGNLDAHGCQLASAPGMPPRFVSAPTKPEGSTDAPRPQAPGDENWDGRFGTANVSDIVNAVAVTDTGDAYIGGNFTTAGGMSANYIVKWSREGWTPLSNGMNNSVFAIAVSDTGDVYVGGPGEPCGSGNLPYFRPGSGATRGQLTKIVSNAAGFTDPAPATYTFTDVPVSSTFHIYVERLLLNRPGVIGGYACGNSDEPCDQQNPSYFRPSNPLTRGQTTKIVGNTFYPNCQTLAQASNS